jgi:hypothetical protein
MQITKTIIFFNFFHLTCRISMKYFTKHKGPQNRPAKTRMGRLEKEVKLGSQIL